MLWNGQKGGGLSLRVKRDERVEGLVVGWGGCECDGLVSNTLSLSMTPTSTHPQWSPTVQCVFQSHCVVAHFNQCVGAAVLSHFFPPLFNHFLIDEWLWGLCDCRATILPMLGPATLCVMLNHASFFLNVVTLKNVFEFVI